MGWLDDVQKSWMLFSKRWSVFLCVGFFFILLPTFLSEGFSIWYAGHTGADALLTQYESTQQELMRIVQEHLSLEKLPQLEGMLGDVQERQSLLRQQLSPYFRVAFSVQLLSILFGLFGYFTTLRLFISPQLPLSKVYGEARARYFSFVGLLVCVLLLTLLLSVVLFTVGALFALAAQGISPTYSVLSFLFLGLVLLCVGGYALLPLQLTSVLFVQDELSPLVALERSWKLVAGKRWLLVGRFIGFGALLLLAYIPFLIVSYSLHLSSLAFPGMLWTQLTSILFSLIAVPVFVGYLVLTVKSFQK